MAGVFFRVNISSSAGAFTPPQRGEARPITLGGPACGKGSNLPFNPHYLEPNRPKGRGFQIIREIVKQIPKGKVAAYGQIAKMAGISDPRVVGWAMRGNQDPKIPCQRVIKTGGFLAENYSLGGWLEQRRRLEKDGIKFFNERQVDLKKYRWCPAVKSNKSWLIK